MEKALKEHIEQLHRRMELLAVRIQETNDLQKRNKLEAEFRAANLALDHYRQAIAIERSLSEASS
jgi:hypothetical protein